MRTNANQCEPCQPAQGHKPKRGDGANAEEILTAESTAWLIAFMPERALTRAKRSSEGAKPAGAAVPCGVLKLNR